MTNSPPATVEPRPPADAGPPAVAPEAALVQLLEAHRGERHVIVLQNYPDAIASAYCVR